MDSKKDFRVIVVCGAKKRGKSTFIKIKLVSGYKGNLFINDVNNEYGDKGVVLPFKEFIARSMKQWRTLNIFEDATIYLSNKGDSEELKHLMVLARHRANTIVFVFHSLQSIPSYILTQSDLLVLFKTTENVGLIKNKFKYNVDILRAFVDVNNKTEPYARVFVTLHP